MSHDNQFHQYGYDHYLKAPRKSRSKSAGLGARIMAGLQSPLVATGALLVTGVVFATIIFMAYPSDDEASREIPVIRADLSPVKTVPEDRDFAEIPNRDNTVLANIGQERPAEDLGAVENLLAPPEDNFVTKEAALEQALAEQSPYEDPVESTLEATAQVTPTLIQEAQKIEERSVQAQENVIQKIEAAPAPVVEETVIAKIVPEEAAPVAEDRKQMHAAATSPETIDFVRSVLNADNPQDLGGTEKTAQADVAPAPIVKLEPAPKVTPKPKPTTTAAAKQDPAKSAAQIAPAAGAAAPAVNVQAGNYFVQLASITDRSRAAAEYSKMQSSYSVLSGVSYRVQEASLDKGKFFRIQAGPMSKESASRICEAIKTQKPGGCLVTK